ncbi:NUDIX domain-containing protein [Rhodococcus sp. IEGM 1401]|uniref:NUDIX hydrolase n=1 Tax=unclassified Rhodococcus (in: high G+C Gram-positive bacteria) TaxID=192944 RepID=UPI0022B3B12E|nr:MULTISPECIES: NUDIX domain-containing protein [unclassified Rhodococcus (in: high G+C Gram-positive bacteria)]MCZ4563378.1 NUDIX domain-containing protein [Rhodococcus sp. IEGM 1401]MDI9923501.1 NUDIX domain-containing protein [Rhodococcus sp. IEGM 1372]MDV8035991.1 NUDIX domain-containing protein [Rhodococcus sp. IEGM 1414]
MGYRHSVSVSGVVFNAAIDAFLVIRRADNAVWEVPGGILEGNETIEAGLIREVLEETCVTVRPTRLTGVYKNMSMGYVALVFSCELLSGEPCPTVESSEVKWMSLHEIRRQMCESMAQRVVDAHDADRPVIRHHDGRHLLTNENLSRTAGSSRPTKACLPTDDLARPREGRM